MKKHERRMEASKPNTLDLTFKYLQDVFLHFTTDDVPVFGDLVEVECLGQLFSQALSFTATDEDLKSPQRFRAKLVGEALVKIGHDIVMQVEHGVATTRISNGRKVVTF